MAATCPPQTLTETFNTEFDDTVSMYETNDIKLEKVVESAALKDEFNQEKTFFDLTPTSYLLDSYNQDYACDVEYKDLKSWTEKHPDSWSSTEVLDWIYYVANEYKLDVSRLHGENFRTVTGYQLSRMTLRDFTDRDPDYGHYYFNILRQLYNGVRFIPPTNMDHIPEQVDEPVSLNYPAQEVLTGFVPQEMEMADAETSRMLDNNLETMLDMKDGVPKVNIGGTWYDIADNLDDLSNMDIEADPGYESGDAESDFGCSVHSKLPNDLFSDDEEITPVVKEPPTKKTKTSKRVNSTSSDSGNDSEDGNKSPRGRKPGQSSKGNHLWEFIRDLLKDSNMNPSLLRWEDKETGVFRFVQSEAVAQMWGRKKNNPGMTYEKLSRAMRFCRSAGYFAGVPKNGKYPKKLCFRFGPKSFGWQSV